MSRTEYAAGIADAGADYGEDAVTIWMPVDPEANELLSRSPLALVIAMLLDQQVTLEKAFMGPLDLVRRLRRARSRLPVLVLTARASLQSRVTGLNTGADDYLVKPFALEELEARAGALIRRGVGGSGAVLSHGRLTLDTAGRIAALEGVPLDLPRRELCLLELLLLRAGQVVQKQVLLEKLFSYDEDAGLNAIEIYVHRLRKKLSPGGLKISTVRGVGYCLEAPQDE